MTSHGRRRRRCRRTRRDRRSNRRRRRRRHHRCRCPDRTGSSRSTPSASSGAVVAQRDRPDARVGERAQRRRATDGRPRVTVERVLRRQVGAVRVDPDEVRQRRVRRQHRAVIGGLVARGVVGLVDELELALTAGRDHVHRRPVVVVGVHPQAGLLVVLVERRDLDRGRDRPRAARRHRLRDDVHRARRRPGRSSRCRSAASRRPLATVMLLARALDASSGWCPATCR